MKKRKCKKLCGFMIGVMLVSCVAGCGSGDSNDLGEKGENTFVYEDDSKELPVSQTIMGRVTSVEGESIQIEVLDFPERGNAGDMPEGEAPKGEKPEDEKAEEAPEGEKPEGERAEEAPKGEKPGEAPEGEEAVLTLGDSSVVSGEIREGAMISITFDENKKITAIEASEDKEGKEGMDGNGMGPGGQAAFVESYDALTEYNQDAEIVSENFTSTNADENAILVTEGAKVTLNAIQAERTSEDSTGGDTASFYGVGAAVLATDGEVNITDSSITTDAPGGAGLFAYGDGIVKASTTKIDTKQDTSGGIHVAGGGTLYADNLEVTTEGNSSAAIRSDRGGGTMVVNNGSYTSKGTGSPAVYCTADITVNNANLTAAGSEAVCMEGLNNLHFNNCNITGNMGDDEQNDTTWTMIVYQSMSGDSQVGNATMEIQGGSIISENGGLLYTTNTQSNILLSDVDITYSDDSEFFLQCTGNQNKRGWGTVGENGADCTFTAQNQEMEGNVIWDSVSKLTFNMKEGSVLTGAVVQDETWAGDGGDGYADLDISEDSKWIVTGDSTLTNLYSEGTIIDEDGKTVTVKGVDGTTYIEGDSRYTVTVNNYGASSRKSQ